MRFFWRFKVWGVVGVSGMRSKRELNIGRVRKLDDKV